MFGSGLERLNNPCSGIITIIKIGVGAASASAADYDDDVIVGRLLRRSLQSVHSCSPLDRGSEKAQCSPRPSVGRRADSCRRSRRRLRLSVCPLVAAAKFRDPKEGQTDR